MINNRQGERERSGPVELIAKDLGNVALDSLLRLEVSIGHQEKMREGSAKVSSINIW